MILAIPLTILLYLALKAIHAKRPIALLNPVLWSIAISAAILLLFNLDINAYAQQTQLFTTLLELAVVALAIPLYRQINQLKHRIPIMILLVSLGIVSATTSAFVIAHALNAPAELSASLATLSVTTPITLLVTEKLGGIGSIAASMVILIGVVGAILGFSTLRKLGINDNAAQGLALGGACHAIGTATAIADNEVSAAYASAAMALSALLTPLIVPWYYPWLVSHFAF